jgi:hypothetical protein
VLHEIIGGERLLEHTQSKSVERFEGAYVRGIVERVCAVAINGERDATLDGFMRGTNMSYIGARRDLDPDPAVPFIDCAEATLCQEIRVRLNSKRDAGFDTRSRPAIGAPLVRSLVQQSSERQA